MMRKFQQTAFLRTGRVASATGSLFSHQQPNQLRCSSDVSSSSSPAQTTPPPTGEAETKTLSAAALETRKDAEKLNLLKERVNTLRKVWGVDDSHEKGGPVDVVSAAARTMTPWDKGIRGLKAALVRHTPFNAEEAFSKKSGFSVWLSVKSAERFQQADEFAKLAEFSCDCPTSVKVEVKNLEFDLKKRVQEMKHEIVLKKQEEDAKRELYGAASSSDDANLMEKKLLGSNLGEGLLDGVNDQDPMVKAARSGLNSHLALLPGEPEKELPSVLLSEGVVLVHGTIYVHQSKLPDPEMIDWFFRSGHGTGHIAYNGITGKILPLRAQRAIIHARHQRFPNPKKPTRFSLGDEEAWPILTGEKGLKLKTKAQEMRIPTTNSIWVTAKQFKELGLEWSTIGHADQSAKLREVTVSGGATTYYHLSKIKDGTHLLYDLSTKTDPYPMLQHYRSVSLCSYTGQPKVPFWIDGTPVPPSTAKKILSQAASSSDSSKKEAFENTMWWAQARPEQERFITEDPYASTGDLEEAGLTALWNKDLPSKKELQRLQAEGCMGSKHPLSVPVTFRGVSDLSFDVFAAKFTKSDVNGNLLPAPEGIPAELTYLSQAVLNAAQLEYRIPINALKHHQTKFDQLRKAAAASKDTNGGGFCAVSTNGDFAFHPEKGLCVHWNRLVRDLNDFKTGLEETYFGTMHDVLPRHLKDRENESMVDATERGKMPHLINIPSILDKLRFIAQVTKNFTVPLHKANVAFNAWTAEILPPDVQAKLAEASSSSFPDCSTVEGISQYFPANALDSEKPVLSLWVSVEDCAQFAWEVKEDKGKEAVSGYHHISSLVNPADVLEDLSFKEMPNCWPLLKFIHIDPSKVALWQQPKYHRDLQSGAPILPFIARQLQAKTSAEFRFNPDVTNRWTLLPLKPGQTPPEYAVSVQDPCMRTRFYVNEKYTLLAQEELRLKKIAERKAKGESISRDEELGIGVPAIEDVKDEVLSQSGVLGRRAKVREFRDNMVDPMTKLRGFHQVPFHRVDSQPSVGLTN